MVIPFTLILFVHGARLYTYAATARSRVRKKSRAGIEIYIYIYEYTYEGARKVFILLVIYVSGKTYSFVVVEKIAVYKQAWVGRS